MTTNNDGVVRLLFVGDVYAERAIRGRGGYCNLARVLTARRRNVASVTLGTGCAACRSAQCRAREA